MSHRYYDGTIYHKRFSPKIHDFKYKFFMLDIDISKIDTLRNRLFSLNRFNLFSFHTKNHFGSSKSFNENVEMLLSKFSIKRDLSMRFITLPSICGFVFNPISVLVVFDNNKPCYMLAEVHNYNGGRVVYFVELSSKDGRFFKGKSVKNMYVSPFFKREGDYKFTLEYTEKNIALSVSLYEDDKRVLNSTFKAESISFSELNIIKLFFKHTLLTFWVVFRTLYQSVKLKLKGISWNSPTSKDKIRRF